MIVQRDGRIALTALPPLARLDPDSVDLLARIAPELRLSQWRTVSVLDCEPAAATALSRALEATGLVTTAGSGWNGLSACAGMGACGKALLDVRAIARRRAAVRGGDAPREHWSGCERRCGLPANAEISVIAHPDAA
jgi:sulfite reductase beta subunit-like hemoprotein